MVAIAVRVDAGAADEHGPVAIVAERGGLLERPVPPDGGSATKQVVRHRGQTSLASREASNATGWMPFCLCSRVDAVRLALPQTDSPAVDPVEAHACPSQPHPRIPQSKILFTSDAMALG